jgi:hypothetical protein
MSDVWMSKFEELKEYHEKYGHFPHMPSSTSKKSSKNAHIKLSIWFHNQCGTFRDKKMNDHRKMLMNETFGDWSTPGISRDQVWMDRFNQMKEFYAKEKCFPDRTSSLGGWLYTQRQNVRSKKRGAITAERRRMMDLAFPGWSITTKSRDTWIDKFNEVLELYKKYGRLPMYTLREKKMASWIESQRRAIMGTGRNVMRSAKRKMLDNAFPGWTITRNYSKNDERIIDDINDPDGEYRGVKRKRDDSTSDVLDTDGIDILLEASKYIRLE